MTDFEWVFRTLMDLREFAALNNRLDLASAIDAAIALEGDVSRNSGSIDNIGRKATGEPSSTGPDPKLPVGPYER